MDAVGGGLFGQRLAVVEDAARLVADDPLRVEEGDGTACEDRLKGAAAVLAPPLQLLVGQAWLARGLVQQPIHTTAVKKINRLARGRARLNAMALTAPRTYPPHLPPLVCVTPRGTHLHRFVR